MKLPGLLDVSRWWPVSRQLTPRARNNVPVAVERERIRTLNPAPPRGNAEYVLYWCQANRRVESNHALAHAVEIANENGLPLLVYEGLDHAYKGANDRLHTFILEGVPEMARALHRMGGVRLPSA